MKVTAGGTVASQKLVDAKPDTIQMSSSGSSGSVMHGHGRGALDQNSGAGGGRNGGFGDGNGSPPGMPSLSAIVNDAARDITDAQKRSVERFNGNMPMNVSHIAYSREPFADNVTVSGISPAKNAGYYKSYEKTIDGDGNKVEFTKRTYDPYGKIIKETKS